MCTYNFNRHVTDKSAQYVSGTCSISTVQYDNKAHTSFFFKYGLLGVFYNCQMLQNSPDSPFKRIAAKIRANTCTGNQEMYRNTHTDDLKADIRFWGQPGSPEVRGDVMEHLPHLVASFCVA
jgi:hypothetical protein